MRHFRRFFDVIVCSAVWAAVGVVRAYASSEVTVTSTNAEIVVAADAARSLPFAAKELNGILERALGARLPVVTRPTEGRVSIVLGSNVWSRAAGIDTAAFPRDAFTICAKGNRIIVAGRDDATCDLEKEAVNRGRMLMREHATLFGVYELLERFAGVRFYFPGEIGTVVPKTESIRVPEGTFTVAPNFTVRNVYLQGDGAVPDETDVASRNRWKALAWLRLRMQTDSIPCCHGQRGFRFPERFHKTHPEYFALLKRDGKTLKRDVAEHQVSDCDVQMCHTSGIWDEMYLDCKAYLSGAKAETRGVLSRWAEGYGWNSNCHGRFIDVMAQDGMPQCLCENCQKAYDKTKKQFATELVWGNTAKLANRLTADGFDCILTQMAYPPYRDVPKCALPSNVWVMVAEMGPWGEACPGKSEAEIAEVRSWAEKLGHKVWMWTYPSKFGRKATPGVPDMAPRACAKYYRRTVPYSFGAFCESENEKSIFHYLNYYVFAKLAWDPDVDVEALLDEHFRLMFGAAAPEMAQFYRELEEKWTRQVLSRWHDTRDGKDFVVATDVTLWKEIYSKAVRTEWGRLFDRAADKVAGDPDALRRLQFVRREFLDYMNGFGDAFERASDPEPARARYRALDPAKNLFPMMSEPAHLASTNAAKGASKSFSLKGKLKPNTKYRISGVFRLKDVVPDKGRSDGGCWFDGYVGSWQWFPRGGAVYSGTTDWTYRAYEFTTPAEGTYKVEPRMGFVLNRAVGEAWVGCLTLEEVPSPLEAKR